MSVYMNYLKRDGVTKDGEKAHCFDAEHDLADDLEFSKSCEDDRHHFRFIVSPEDMTELQDTKAFTRDLMKQMEADLHTSLEWKAIEHWNTDNPHIHVVVRGKADNSKDLVIARDYISHGFRSRAEELVSIELGPKPEHEIEKALQREVTAERWTKLDRELMGVADEMNAVDLRLSTQNEYGMKRRNLMIGRLQHLGKMSLAENIGPSQWMIKPDAEATLRSLAIRGDIIKTMHIALSNQNREFEINNTPKPVIGRLVEKGLHDELTGEAYAVIDGVDGKAHYVRFPNINVFEHAPQSGGIVELRPLENAKSKTPTMIMSLRSDFDLSQQIKAEGATWLDHRLVEHDPMKISNKGFGKEVIQSKKLRLEFLQQQGLAEIKNKRLQPVPNLISNLKEKEISNLAKKIEAETGLKYQKNKQGETVKGIYKRRFSLMSGRYAMLDNGLGFQLVPWAPSIERQKKRMIQGMVRKTGGIDWNIQKNRSLYL
ncbi:relaxase/mobilization nuclease domain-containing protein [Bartonella sp. LJL80]